MNDSDLIKETINYFFEGFDLLDNDLIKKAFFENAILYAYNQEKKLVKIDFDEWLEMFERIKANPHHPYNQEKSTKEIIYIDITGHAAQAKVLWSFSKFKFIDYYNLIKTDGVWKIVNKIWYTEVF